MAPIMATLYDGNSYRVASLTITELVWAQERDKDRGEGRDSSRGPSRLPASRNSRGPSLFAVVVVLPDYSPALEPSCLSPLLDLYLSSEPIPSR
ncbi:hypothetical protein CRG98_031775 [Punica granatum]|uniref:Uncharacterized protein n=1 Tax=Punica granatum TaxID=22663 RepID=A0A2I0IV02_PUNGR|nr:hypothetical protein CRG98_031775 [Punica granatum]